MLLGILLLISALSVSAVAIYYSVAGLVAIFAAAVLPIIIMGTVLEVAKLVTAVWLHHYWHQAAWWLKTYLTSAVIVLMCITSLGIFGFLSKAHIEQTVEKQTSADEMQMMQQTIQRRELDVVKAEQRIVQLETSGSGVRSNIQQQIDKEQAQIDTEIARAQPAINEQQQIIQQQQQIIQQQINNVDSELALLQQLLEENNIQRVQQLVGAEADGNYGPNTQLIISEYRAQRSQQKQTLVNQLATVNSLPVVQSARQEIATIRQSLNQRIADTNQSINALRSRLTNDTGNSVEVLVGEQRQVIQSAIQEITTLSREQSIIKAEFRKLEAEVGPIKYIAELLHDTPQENNLEDAVRGVILMLIFVFDPLAILMLVASQATFAHHRKQKAEQKKSISISNDQLPTDDAPTKDDIEVSQLPTDDAPEVKIDEVAKQYSCIDQSSTDSQESPLPVAMLHENTETDEVWSEAKRKWKDQHPDETLKEYKERYINGGIDKLPWQDYLAEYYEKPK